MNLIDSVEPLFLGVLENKRGRRASGIHDQETRAASRGARNTAVSRTDTLLPMTLIRPEQARSRSLAVLIEVPAVKAHPAERGTWPSPRRLEASKPRVNRPRRRLRRRVRLAGCALLALVPMVSLGTLGWSSRPSRILACAIPDVSESGARAQGSGDSPSVSNRSAASVEYEMSSSGMITLSVEPATGSSTADARVPVIFPGYVLPDDALEDRAHAGS
jgi:hypothetical protein